MCEREIEKQRVGLLVLRQTAISGCIVKYSIPSICAVVVFA